MNQTSFLQKIIIIFFSCVFSISVSAETIKYTGTVSGHPVKHLMPLGNGDAVLTMQSIGVIALSGTPPTINTMKCSGLGYQTVDDKTTTDFYCNIAENDEDSFDIKGTASEVNNEADGSFKVIGGSGKWKDATGKGKFIRYDKTDTSNKMFLEMEITKP